MNEHIHVRAIYCIVISDIQKKILFNFSSHLAEPNVERSVRCAQF